MSKSLLEQALERAAKQFPEFPSHEVVAMVNEQRDACLANRYFKIPEGASVGKIVTGEVMLPKGP